MLISQVVEQGFQREIRPFWRRYELPTWGLFFAIYGGWLALTLHWSLLPFWAILPLAAYVLALHNSFQHETIHGHPTKSVTFNSILGGVSLNLWVPYGIYRDGHLKHHNKQNIANPLEDPESFYVTQAQWDKMSPRARKIRLFFNTFTGRLFIGPALSIYNFLTYETKNLLAGDHRNLRHWLVHLASVAPIISWLVYCDIPLWQYFVLAIYPSHSLNMMRSFAEHRAAENAEERMAIVESIAPFGLLYLYNNLHFVHHERPAMPWYEIPAAYKKNRSEILVRNGGYWFSGYAEILKAYWNTPWDHPVHKG